MAEGLEIRCPFLDKKLVEFTASLPGAMHFDWFHGKKLLHKACQDLVPPVILQRKKMGFGIPLNRVVSAEKPSGDVLPFSLRGHNKLRALNPNSQKSFLADQLSLFFS
jgi:hypothetical protein